MVTPSSSPCAIAITASTSTAGRLDGAFLSPSTLLLIACGTLGGILFAIVYLVGGATRPGYDPWQQAISALSLGPGGEVQQINFVVFGILAFISAFGWRMALKGGAGATWYPILKSIAGIGLVVDGFFSQDPAIGYPVGAVVGAPTTHGIIHNLFAFVVITALAISNFVLARRFATEARWRGWTVAAVLTGVFTIVFIALFGATNGYMDAPAGLFERLATGVNTILGVTVLARLLLDRRHAARQ